MKQAKISVGIWISLAIILSVIVILLALVISSYNSLISVDQNVKKAWADVQVQYERRADLIPNLVKVVQGSKDFQLSAIEKITTARENYLDTVDEGTISDQIQAAKVMDRQINEFLLLVENYPNLKTEEFSNLMVQLEGTENRIAVARTNYNEVVAVYNKVIKRFPGLIFANMFGFTEKPYFEAEQRAEDVPLVEIT